MNLAARLRQVLAAPLGWELALYVAAALTPLLWFHGNAVITGGDIDYPFDPLARLMHRAFTWDRLFYGGTDLSLNVSTLVFTAIEAIPWLLTDDVAASERFAFIVWFLALGLSMAYAVASLFPGRQLLRIVATFFYLFNFYQFSNWESFRIGEMSAAVVLPVVLGAIARAVRGDLRPPAFALTLAGACLFGMGIGVQPPAQIVVALVTAAFFVAQVLDVVDLRDREARRRVLTLAGLTIAVPVLVSAFWLLPELNFVMRSGYGDAASAASVYDTAFWLEWTSRYASVAHNLALMGHVVGYDTWNGAPYLPMLYAHFTSPLISAAGMLIPIGAFAALVVRRTPLVLFFATAALTSLFLSKGIHAPWGESYLWLTQHVPGFWVFRAPWEKFALVTAVSFAVLIGVTVDAMAGIVGRVAGVRVRPAVAALAVAAIVAYHYPLVAGGMFPAGGERGTLPGFHQNVPPYVIGMAEWLNNRPGDYSIATFPTDHSAAYDWGYGSPLDITTRLFNKNVIAPQYGQGVAPPHPVFGMANRLSEALYGGDVTALPFYASLLDVQYMLQRNDSLRDLTPGRIDTPSWMRARFAAQPGVSIAERAGSWDLYLVTAARGRPRVSLADSIATVGSESRDPRLERSFVAGFDALGHALGALPLETAVVSPRDRDSDPVLRGLPAFFGGPATAPGAAGLAVATAVPHASARYYVQSKAVLQPAGGGDPDAIVNDAGYPFQLPGTAPDWNAADATLLFLQSGSVPLVIDAIYDGERPVDAVSGVLWRDGWLGFQTRPFAFPMSIPANRRAIVQINHRFTSSAVDVLTEAGTLRVRAQRPEDPLAAAGFRSFPAVGSDRTFRLHAFVTGAFDIDAVLAQPTTGDIPLEVDGRIVARGEAHGTRLRWHGVRLGAGDHTARLHVSGDPALASLSAFVPPPPRTPIAQPAYRDLDPTATSVTVESDRPGLLVFSENYHPQWLLFRGQPSPWCRLLGCGTLSAHVRVNGYANGWTIPAGRSGYTIVFWPQVLVQLGLAVVFATVAALAAWFTVTARRPARS